jgi:hypothetical protein
MFQKPIKPCYTSHSCSCSVHSQLGQWPGSIHGDTAWFLCPQGLNERSLPLALAPPRDQGPLYSPKELKEKQHPARSSPRLNETLWKMQPRCNLFQELLEDSRANLVNYSCTRPSETGGDLKAMLCFGAPHVYFPCVPLESQVILLSLSLPHLWNRSDNPTCRLDYHGTDTN